MFSFLCFRYVKKSFKSNHSNFNARSWLTHFLKRNKKTLKNKPLKVIAKGRTDDSSIASTEEFITTIKEKAEGFNMTADKLINVDEFQLKISGYTAGKGKISAVRKSGSTHKQISTETRGGNIGSLISFICADGTLIYSALCLKPDGKIRNKEDIFYILSDSIERHGVSTRKRPIPQLRIYKETGMIDNEAWDLIFSKFLQHLKDISPGKEYLVYMDNLPQHTQLTTIQKGLNQGVHCMFLVKGTSQYSQPNGRYPFGAMRRFVNKEGSINMGKNFQSEKLNTIIRDLVPRAMSKSFSPDQIRKSFEVTGLWPLDEEILRKNCLENLGGIQDNEEKEPDVFEELEETTMNTVKGFYKEKKSIKTQERVKATIGLNQAYTSGHVLYMHEEERKKREEAQMKTQKKEAQQQRKLEKEREKEEKKAVQAQKKEDARKKKEAKLLETQSTHCVICKRRKTIRSKDFKDWFRCELCWKFTVCSQHKVEKESHLLSCTNQMLDKTN